MKVKPNSRKWMTLKSLVVIFQALEPLQPQWPEQSKEPQWPQWPQKPHFTKEITEFYVSTNHGTKMTYPGLSIWNGSSKTHYFTDFWHPFSWRLWRPAWVIFLKIGSINQNVHISDIQNYLGCGEGSQGKDSVRIMAPAIGGEQPRGRVYERWGAHGQTFRGERTGNPDWVAVAVLVARVF